MKIKNDLTNIFALQERKKGKKYILKLKGEHNISFLYLRSWRAKLSIKPNKISIHNDETPCDKDFI